MTKNSAAKYLIETLKEAGFNEAESDARLLLEYIAGINRNDLILNGNEEVDEALFTKLKEAVEKRLTHIPVQQITGYQNFMGLEFAVNENVLIPRQDTECLVEEVLKLGFSGADILDMCTGSGCILLSILKYSHDFKGTGVDISPKALEVAEKNSRDLGIEARFIESNLFEKLSADEKFDIIVSNPPYIKSDVIPTLMEEVRCFEPMIALDGEADGLSFYRKIIEMAPQYLRCGGKLYFEIGYDQGREVSELMKAAGFEDINVVKDLAGLDRVVYGEWG